MDYRNRTRMKTGPTKPSLTELLDAWEPLDEEFPEIEELPLEPVDLNFSEEKPVSEEEEE